MRYHLTNVGLGFIAMFSFFLIIGVTITYAPILFIIGAFVGITWIIGDIIRSEIEWRRRIH